MCAGDKKMQVRLVARGCETVLADAASEAELFLTDDLLTRQVHNPQGPKTHFIHWHQTVTQNKSLPLFHCAWTQKAYNPCTSFGQVSESLSKLWLLELTSAIWSTAYTSAV